MVRLYETVTVEGQQLCKDALNRVQLKLARSAHRLRRRSVASPLGDMPVSSLVDCLL